MTSKIDRRNTKFAYMVNAPLIIYLLCVLVGPMIWGVSLSFTNKTIGGSAEFNGLSNYISLLKNPEYRLSILNTVKFTVFSITGKAFFGVLMALALNVEFRGRNLVRALLLIPWTLPNIVAVLNWRWIFSATGGIANYLLKSVHLIDKDLVWFGSAGLAMATIIVANVWRGTPFFGISVLAKLQTIPNDYYEAAAIDGATLWQKFRYITLPEIKDVLLLSTLMSTIWTINEFESVWLLTGGGPNGSTQVMNVFSYKTAMKSMQLGKGIAVSILAMPVLILLINLLSRKMLGNDDN
ncbi:sugar ABC transporter permease [Clostridium sp. chh4-2]|uniref:carbohydrate ABC transporter permease n=1 Tax=Clostridium sp. chh4-2 TaxID=2067550 RepID=UPI001FA8D731|nr:sugar ABC transporter permease [Clostridium sp. chh4-2]